MNYRTLVNCGRSRRMRQALEEFRDAGGASGNEPGDDTEDMWSESLDQRVAALEEENHGLRELVEDLKGQLEKLARRVDALGASAEPAGNPDAGQVGDVQSNDQGQDWRPPRRRPGTPDAGVVTLEEQPEEEHAFGPAAALVAEWRELRTSASLVGSRVDRAKAVVRRWELEAKLLCEFHLTLPPETKPLDELQRTTHVRRRREALAVAQRELVSTARARLFRRVLNCGLVRK